MDLTREEISNASITCARAIAGYSTKIARTSSEVEKQKYERFISSYKILNQLCMLALDGTVASALTSTAEEAAAVIAGYFGRRCRVPKKDYHFYGDPDKTYYIIGGNFVALNHDGVKPAEAADADIGIQLSIAREDQENINSYWTVNLSDVELLD